MKVQQRRDLQVRQILQTFLMKPFITAGAQQFQLANVTFTFVQVAAGALMATVALAPLPSLDCV